MRPIRALRAIIGILRHGYGHLQSARRHCPVDKQGRPLPWFTYPAIEFLSQFDFSQNTVFEFGAGNSTLYWGTRASKVVSVESDGLWYKHLCAQIPASVRLVYAPDPSGYVGEIDNHPEGFDVIVVDGIERLACARAAPARLREGGLIILDNADWHPGCAAVLREAGLLQVDMTGFGPVNGYTWTTSFFFDRRFDFSMAGKVRPLPGIGSIRRVVN